MENGITKKLAWTPTRTSPRLIALTLIAARLQAAHSGRWAQRRARVPATFPFTAGSEGESRGVVGNWEPRRRLDALDG
jgi:hypothetical protein